MALSIGPCITVCTALSIFIPLLVIQVPITPRCPALTMHIFFGKLVTQPNIHHASCARNSCVTVAEVNLGGGSAELICQMVAASVTTAQTSERVVECESVID